MSKTLKEIIKFFNTPLDKKMIKYYESDLDHYYKIKIASQLTAIRSIVRLLSSIESIIKTNSGDMKEKYDMMRDQIMLGIYEIKKWDQAYKFLNEQNYSKQLLEPFLSEIENHENMLLRCAKKYGDMTVYD